MRFAGPQHLAAERLIQFGERAGAINQAVSALDHDIGIGTDHGQAARMRSRQHVPIIFRGLGFIVEQAAADDVVGALDRFERDAEIAKQRAGSLSDFLKDVSCTRPA